MCASDEEVEEAAEDAAYFESSLQMAAYRTSTADVNLTDTRRAMCVGDMARSFFAFFSQPPHFVVQRVLGAAMVVQGEESDTPMPAVGENGGADELGGLGATCELVNG